MTEPLKTIIDRREAVIKILERDAQDAHDKLANAAPPVQVPNSIRVPLDSLHADAEYLLARLLAGTLTREQVVGVIRDRIDAARLEIDGLHARVQELERERAVAAEREACAKLVQDMSHHRRWVRAGINGEPIRPCEYATAIRASGAQGESNG